MTCKHKFTITPSYYTLPMQIARYCCSTFLLLVRILTTIRKKKLILQNTKEYKLLNGIRKERQVYMYILSPLIQVVVLKTKQYICCTYQQACRDVEVSNKTLPSPLHIIIKQIRSRISMISLCLYFQTNDHNNQVVVGTNHHTPNKSVHVKYKPTCNLHK